MWRVLLAGCGLLLLSPIPAMAQQAEPPAVQRFRNDMIQGCRDSGGGQARLEPGFLRRVDISRDGVADYVLDASKVNCPRAQTFTCGSAGCPVQVIVSQGGRPVVALDSYAQEIHVEPGAAGDVVVVNGRRMAWDGARLVAAGAGAPPGRPAPQAQAQAPAGGGNWRIFDHNGMRRAQGAASGAMRDVLFVCGQRSGAVMAISLQRPMASQIPVTIEVGNLRMTVPFNRFAPDMLFWEAEASAMRTLPNLFVGSARQVLFSVNGQPLGSVALDGAGAAIRTALSPCHRFPPG
jgi:hypothetical protein